MNENERKLVKSALRPFVDSGMISAEAMNEITAEKTKEGRTAPPQLLTRPEAMERLGVCLQTMVNYEKAGLLNGIRIAGRRMVRYRSSDIEALLEVKKVA